MTAPMDRDALLCALVLAPSTYSRNRFFSLYQDDEFRVVRRRASIVRSLVRQLARQSSAPSVEPAGDGWVLLTIDQPELSLRRSTRLQALELALVRYQVARAQGVKADAERAPIEEALARLGPSAI